MAGQHRAYNDLPEKQSGQPRGRRGGDRDTASRLIPGLHSIGECKILCLLSGGPWQGLGCLE